MASWCINHLVGAGSSHDLVVVDRGRHRHNQGDEVCTILQASNVASGRAYIVLRRAGAAWGSGISLLPTHP